MLLLGSEAYTCFLEAESMQNPPQNISHSEARTRRESPLSHTFRVPLVLVLPFTLSKCPTEKNTTTPKKNQTILSSAPALVPAKR